MPKTEILSPAQIVIMKRISQGIMSKQIARELGISIRTVDNQVTIAVQKLKGVNRTHAAVIFDRNKRDWERRLALHPYEKSQLTHAKRFAKD